MINISAKNNIMTLKIAAILFLTTTFLLQILSFRSESNYLVSSILYISSIIASLYIFKVKNIISHPLSTLMILGYSLYYFFLPPLATFFESKPVINNLDLPVTTSIHTAVGLLSLISAHFLYKNIPFFNSFRSFIQYQYQTLKIFSPLNFNQILIISVITLFSQVISIIFKNLKNENIVLKLLDGINYFIFIPYILLGHKLIKVRGNRHSYLVYFSFATLIIGIFFNARSFVFIGYANIIILFFFLFVFGIFQFSLKLKNLLKIIASISVIFILIEPATKLVISMALARNIRDEATPIELIDETYHRFKSIENVSEVIQDFEDLHYEQDVWDEHYVNNPFFARLCNLKYADNIFVINESLSTEDKYLARNQEIDKIYAILPNPLLKLLNIRINKEETTSGSMGDYLFFLSGGTNKVEGSRTGSLIGTSFIIFGWAYPLFFIILTICVYIIGDSLVFISQSEHLKSFFSPIAFLSLYPFLFFFTSSALGMESISGVLSFILRGSIQTPILYFLLLKITNYIIFLFKLK